MSFLAVLIYIFVSFFMGFVLIGLSLSLVDFTYVIIYFQKEVLNDMFLRVAVFLCGLLIILFCIRYVQRIIYRRERSVISELPHGKVSITLFAIEDMIRNMLEAEKVFFHVRPRVKAGKKEVDVIVRGNLSAEVNLPSFTKEAQEKVREKLLNLLGEDKEIKVKIEIRKMIFRGKKKIVEAEEPEVPYRYY